MLPQLIDTHAHLDDDRFRDDFASVLDRARAVGLAKIIAIATGLESTRACIALAQSHSMLRASAGIHPNHAAQAGTSDWDQVVEMASGPAVVGIGETGLDRHWNGTPFPMQEDYFARHLELGRMLAKPVIIHCREADADVQRMLQEEFNRAGAIKGVMHSFTGSLELARACLEIGLYISFAGMVTFKNAQSLQKVAAEIPLDRMLVETDSPYLAPVPHRGKRNEPAFVTHTAAFLSSLRSMTAAEFSTATTKNAISLFGLQV